MERGLKHRLVAPVRPLIDSSLCKALARETQIIAIHHVCIPDHRHSHHPYHHHDLQHHQDLHHHIQWQTLHGIEYQLDRRKSRDKKGKNCHFHSLIMIGW